MQKWKEDRRNGKFKYMTQDKPTIQKALQDFKAKYPTVSIADLQTFIIGYNAASLNRQGWTRVDSGLPEDGEVDVWVKNEYGEYRMPNIKYHKGINDKEKRFFCYMHNDNGITWTDITKEVTHWMPLPNKPI